MHPNEQAWILYKRPNSMLEWIRLAWKRSRLGTFDPHTDCPIAYPNRKLRLFAVACFPGNPQWQEWLRHPGPGAMSSVGAARHAAGLRLFLRQTPRRRGRHLEAPLLTLDQQVARAALLREVCGNPYRLPGPLPPACAVPVVRDLARHIYQHLDFKVLPILADALEETGCADHAVLAHLRTGPLGEPCPECRGRGWIERDFAADWQPCSACGQSRYLCGPHVRGCWALDWALGHPIRRFVVPQKTN